MMMVLGRSGDSQTDIYSMQGIPVRIAASSPHSLRQTVIPNEPEGGLARREKANEGSLIHLLQASYTNSLNHFPPGGNRKGGINKKDNKNKVKMVKDDAFYSLLLLVK